MSRTHADKGVTVVLREVLSEAGAFDSLVNIGSGEPAGKWLEHSILWPDTFMHQIGMKSVKQVIDEQSDELKRLAQQFNDGVFLASEFLHRVAIAKHRIDEALLRLHERSIEDALEAERLKFQISTK